MQTLTSQELALVSGGFSSYSFADDDDDDECLMLITLKGSYVLATEGSNFIDDHVESPYFQAALKISLYSSIILLNAIVLISEITGGDDD